MNDDGGSLIKDGERVLELGRKGYRIIQSPGTFRFGMDSVLLAHFAKTRPGWRVMDLCCGGGVIPLLMHARNPGAAYYGVEIQEAAADAACRSVRLNGLNDQITIINGDIKHMNGLAEIGCFDAVTVNPPYYAISAGKTAEALSRSTARHEGSCELEDIIAAAARLLRFRGVFYLVYKPERLVNAISLARQYKLEPKKLRLVHPYAGRPPSLILMATVKGAKEGLVVDAPLVVYEKEGTLTDELDDIYNK